MSRTRRNVKPLPTIWHVPVKDWTTKGYRPGKMPARQEKAGVAVIRAQTPDVQPAPSAANEMVPPFIPRPPRAELIARGKRLRKICPRRSHAVWQASPDRPDPVQLVKEGDKGRIPELIPVRHGRMIQSPFTYYRGSALAMAVDLASTPTTGVRVQACGDAHLGNFRCFATPERRVIFDIHDLDETLPAPWEWDLKRLAASVVIASRNNGLSEARARDAALTCARSYRERMAGFSQMQVLEVWYYRLDADALFQTIEDAQWQRRMKKRLAKVKARRTLEHCFPKLADTSSGSPIIKDNPPLIYHWHEHGQEEFQAAVKDALARYRDSLTEDRRNLLDRYEFKDLAIMVVGVGSVGTFCAIILLMGCERDPLFLQVKEARASVLEPYAGKSLYANHGQRVVQGHRLMQSASDVFLGWTSKLGRHHYIRQLRDAKLKFPIEDFGSAEMDLFSQWCGYTLARAHARSGESAVIAGYLGESDSFDLAIADFSVAYADQCERDHETVAKAVRAGKLEVLIEPE